MKKIKITSFVILIIVAVLVAIVASRPDQYHTAERIEWKDNAIAELSTIDPSLNILPVTYTHEEWFSPQGLLMKDGSWIACRAMCSKENSDIYDIFIGIGSNGKWYYSTYHFCIGLYTVMEEQPATLNSFIEQCSLVEFDGKSDDCLLSTWPTEDVADLTDSSYSSTLTKKGKKALFAIPIIIVVLLVVAVYCKIRLRYTEEE